VMAAVLLAVAMSTLVMTTMLSRRRGLRRA
jgi:hypothetical protein